MSDAFDKAFAAVIGVEGGYSLDPRDPGGETNFGISKRAYPSVDIKALTLDQAKAIYQRDYWDPLAKYNLDDKFRAVAFDCAVNQGMGKTAELIDASKGQISWFMADRAIAYANNKNFAVFGKGWMRRLFQEVT